MVVFFLILKSQEKCCNDFCYFYSLTYPLHISIRGVDIIAVVINTPKPVHLCNFGVFYFFFFYSISLVVKNEIGFFFWNVCEFANARNSTMWGTEIH